MCNPKGRCQATQSILGGQRRTVFHCQSARRTVIAGQRRNPKNQPNHNKPTSQNATHKTRAPRKSEAKRPAKCLLLSVSSRLKGKSADRWSALGVCHKNKDPTNQPPTAQPKPTKPHQPEPIRAHSLSACRTTGRPREGGDENMEQPYWPIRRGRAVFQEYARTCKTSNQKNPKAPNTTQPTTEQPNKTQQTTDQHTKATQTPSVPRGMQSHRQLFHPHLAA